MPWRRVRLGKAFQMFFTESGMQHGIVYHDPEGTLASRIEVVEERQAT